MKTPIILLFILALFGGSCENVVSSSIDKANKSKMKLKQSIRISIGGNESFVIIPEGSELPAVQKQVVSTNQNQLLSAYFYKGKGEQLNTYNFLGEFWFQRLKETKSPLEIEIIAKSNTKTIIKAIDLETRDEKTMIFMDAEVMTKKVDIEEYLSKNIHQLKSAGGDVNYVIFMLENKHFVQVAIGKDDDLIRCEASVSDGGADGNYEITTITAGQMDQLEALGWKPPEFGEFNYFYWDTIKSTNTLDQIANNFLKTINTAFEGSKITSTTINLE